MTVLVIGGGIIGCAVAESLARANCRVTLLERGTVGTEASSVAAGLLAPQLEAHGPGPFLDLCLASRALFPDVVARLTRDTALPIDFQPTGLYFLVFTEEDAREADTRLTWQVQQGLQIQRLTREELLRREPALNPSVRWGLFFPEDHQVDSAQLTRAYAEAARRRGVTIIEGVEVKQLRHQRGRVHGVISDDGRTWEASIVVDAAGSWAAFDPELPFAIPVEPAKGQLLVYQLTHPLLKRAVKSSQAYCIPRGDGRLIVGTTVEFVGFDRQITAEASTRLHHAAAAVCPQLQQHSYRDALVNFRPATPDRLPLLGATPIKNFYLATGHFRNGILLAPMTAQLMTDLMTTGRASISLEPFSLTRFLESAA